MTGDSQKSWEHWWKEFKTLPSPFEDDYLTIEHHEISLIKRERFPPLNGKLILEAGCGTARHSIILAPNNFVVGVDFSLEALKLAKTLSTNTGFSENSEFILATILHLPFRSFSFDLVWNAGVIEHFQEGDRQKVLNEMSRVTKNWGYVATFVPNAWNVRTKVSSFLFRGRWEFPEIPYSPTELETRLHQAGLEVVCRSGTHIFIPFDGLFNFLGISRKANIIKKSKLLRRLLLLRRSIESLYALHGFELFRLARKTTFPKDK